MGIPGGNKVKGKGETIQAVKKITRKLSKERKN
jgi:hypothetical protein